MKLAWVMVTVVCVAGCMVASMLLFGQRVLWDKMTAGNEERRAKDPDFDATFNETQFARITLQNQLDQQRQTVKKMEGEREKATRDEKEKAAILDICMAARKTTNQELSVLEKEQEDTGANLVKVVAAWEEQIASLKKVMDQPSKICAYIKNNSVGAKLCPTADIAAPAAAA